MIAQLAREILFIYNEAAIYILFGFFIAGLLKVAIPAEKVLHYLGKKKLSSVMWASLIGIPIPLCSCAVLPTAMSLQKKGATKGATLSFLISTPETGVDSISITYALIDPLMTVFRPFAALITALSAGILEHFIDAKSPEEPMHEPYNEGEGCRSDCCIPHEHAFHNQGKIRVFFHYAFVELLNDIAFWLLLGIVIAGVITTIMPGNFIELHVGSGMQSMFVMLLIGVPIYMCAASSTPIAAALILKGLSPGAALVFLLAGPATNIGTILAVKKFLGKKTMIIYLGSIVTVSVVLGFVLNSFYAVLAITPDAIVGHASELLPPFIKMAGSFILLIIIIRNLWCTGFEKALCSLLEKIYDFTGFRIPFK